MRGLKIKKERSFFSEEFEKLQSRQEIFMKTYQIDGYTEWFFDDPSGVFTFCKDDEELFLEYQVIGTYSTEGIWQWAWANNSLHPTIRQASFQVKKFKEEHELKELLKPTIEAHEDELWEMFAIANVALNPIGVYSMELDGSIFFIVFTKKISRLEAIHLKENSVMLIECDKHGLKRPAYVCEHLLTANRTGFHEPFETYKGMELGADEELQAWCDKCEAIRVKYGDDWNEISEKLVKIKMVCEDCFFEIKNIYAN